VLNFVISYKSPVVSFVQSRLEGVAAHYVNNGRCAWVSSCSPTSPIKATELVLNQYNEFRFPTALHSGFDCIFYIQDPLPDANWQLVLDELLRLADKDGSVLALRLDQTLYRSIVAVKSFLFRPKSRHISLIDEVQQDNTYLLVLYVSSSGQHSSFTQESSVDWSICILTNGYRDDNVKCFLDSVCIAAERQKISYQVLIAGPNSHYSLDWQGCMKLEFCSLPSPSDSLPICLQPNPSLPRIAEKKNMLASLSRGKNILISHDRYVLDPLFFEAFSRYGDSFDVCAVRQAYQNGQPYPSMAYYPIPSLSWQKPGCDLDQKNIYPLSYINGGLFVSKRTTLLSIPMNSLLLHNQAEDVEWSMNLLQNGIVPRYNPDALAVTIGIDVSYTQEFTVNLGIPQSILGCSSDVSSLAGLLLNTKRLLARTVASFIKGINLVKDTAIHLVSSILR